MPSTITRHFVRYDQLTHPARSHNPSGTRFSASNCGIQTALTASTPIPFPDSHSSTHVLGTPDSQAASYRSQENEKCKPNLGTSVDGVGPQLPRIAISRPLQHHSVAGSQITTWRPQAPRDTPSGFLSLLPFLASFEIVPSRIPRPFRSMPRLRQINVLNVS